MNADAQPVAPVRRWSAKRWIRAAFTGAVLGALLLGWVLNRADRDLLPPVRAADTPSAALAPLAPPGGEHTLTGTLLTGAGEPADQALIELRAGERPHWTYTDERGAFHLAGLPAGSFELCAVIPGHPTGWFDLAVPAAAEPLVLRLPPERPPLEVLPEIERSRLSGRLVPGGGSPAAGCQVLLRPAPGADPLAGLVSRRSAAGPDGAFAIDAVAHGTYEILILPPLAIAGGGPVLARQDVLHGGEQADLQVSLRCGAIAGVLVDGNGTPREGATVIARLEGALDAVRATVSGAKGEFRLEHLPPGSWRVRVRTGEVDLERVVPVEPGRLQSLDLGALPVPN